jgi:hypothetical protein
VIRLSKERRAEPDISCRLRTHLSMQRMPGLGCVVRKS